MNAGGISLHMFAEGGDALYLSQLLTWAFPLFVHLAHPLQTCSLALLPSHSLLITTTQTMNSTQKMKRE